MNEDKTSSGILSVVPKYATSGSARIDYDFNQMSIHGNYSYNNKTSTQINWTDQFHIGYSQVTELLSDGSKTVYSFVNHDQIKDEPSAGAFTLGMNDDLYNKYTSRKLDRGLLKSIKYYGISNNLLKEETFEYHSDLSDYLKTINRYAFAYALPIRVSANKIYTYYPYLQKKTTIQYANGKSLKEVEEYQYNKYRLLTQATKYISGVADNTHKVMNKYLIDVMDEYNSMTSVPIPASSPLKIYDEMKTRNMFSCPIENITLRNGNVVSSDIVTYKKAGGNAVKDKIYKLEIDTPCPTSNYTPFKILGPNSLNIDNRCTVNQEFINYDFYGNLVYTIDRSGVGTVYLWSYRGEYLVGKIRNITYEEVKSALKPETLTYLSIIESPNIEIIAEINSLREKLPKAQVSTYEYKPSVGLTCMTDPAGKVSYFEYNTQNKLEKQLFKDKNNYKQTIRQYEYNYKQK